MTHRRRDDGRRTAGAVLMVGLSITTGLIPASRERKRPEFDRGQTPVAYAPGSPELTTAIWPSSVVSPSARAAGRPGCTPSRGRVDWRNTRSSVGYCDDPIWQPDCH